MKNREETIKVAAAWWAARLQCLHHDNGENDSANKMAMVFADMIAAKHRPTREQLEKFRDALEGEIRSMPDGVVSLSCDYSPNGILLKAADTAMIDTSVFPYKIKSYIASDNTFTVSDGYGAPYIQITEAPELI